MLPCTPPWEYINLSSYPESSAPNSGSRFCFRAVQSSINFSTSSHLTVAGSVLLMMSSLRYCSSGSLLLILIMSMISRYLCLCQTDPGVASARPQRFMIMLCLMSLRILATTCSIPRVDARDISDSACCRSDVILGCRRSTSPRIILTTVHSEPGAGPAVTSSISVPSASSISVYTVETSSNLDSIAAHIWRSYLWIWFSQSSPSNTAAGSTHPGAPATTPAGKGSP